VHSQCLRSLLNIRSLIIDVYTSRGSVDRNKNKKSVNDTAAETYDNVPLENTSTASQNGFVSISTSKLSLTASHLFAIFSHLII